MTLDQLIKKHTKELKEFQGSILDYKALQKRQSQETLESIQRTVRNNQRKSELINKYGVGFENYIDDYGIDNLALAEEKYLQDRDSYEGMEVD